jgi:hypothetical protein
VGEEGTIYERLKRENVIPKREITRSDLEFLEYLRTFNDNIKISDRINPNMPPERENYYYYTPYIHPTNSDNPTPTRSSPAIR